MYSVQSSDKKKVILLSGDLHLKFGVGCKSKRFGNLSSMHT